MLIMLLSNHSIPDETLVHKVQIVERESVRRCKISDQVVEDALRYIADHLHRTLRVAELCSAMGISRRNLELKFQCTLHHSPAFEIRRQQLARARTLLDGTSLSTEEIARSVGFRSASRFSVMFKAEFGIGPQRYRNEHKRKSRQ